jgi:hypothetical protein
MAASLDDSRIRGDGREWSHLIADTTEELHAVAMLRAKASCFGRR